jgi:hypothetical protein
VERLLERIADLLYFLAVIVILWVVVDTIDWYHNPHHSLNRAFYLIWNGYRR